MNKDYLKEEGIEYPIKLEYFITSIEEENVGTKYGIIIVKTEYLADNVRIETNEINNITNNIYEEKQIIKKLRDNEVTPAVLQDIIEEIL